MSPSQGEGLPCSALIADDDQALCASLRDVLEAKGHRVAVAHTGAEALASCSRESPDALLLDISLPDISGLELISQVEKLRPEVEILVITGHASESSAIRAVSRATIGYMVKPLDLDRLLAILEGIARRKALARENRRLLESLERKNAELERYAYTVSHDLKSPLVTITGFLGLARGSAEKGDFEQLDADLGRIQEAAERMQELLSELLELSRIGRVVNPPEDVDLGVLVREAVALVSPLAHEQHAEISISDDLPVVRGDRIRLLEVYQNLLENAVKFMGDQPRPRIEVGARRNGGDVVLYVEDNGVGVAPDARERVFGLFDKVDRDSGGSGIGLALVRRIVEVHGGTIWIESAGPGRGSRFCFTLPGLPADG